MAKTRVGVIFGGRSGEHEVSLLSARSVMENINRSRFEVVPIFIDHKGRWFIDRNEVYFKATPRSPGVIAKKTGNFTRVDIFFPVLHGTYGEDGTIQGMFEFTAVPFVGTGTLGSAICMDKEAQKLLCEFRGIPVPRSVTVRAFEWIKRPDEIEREASRSIGFPCFVKPVNLGSSVGITKVKKRERLVETIELALRYDRKALVEEAIAGREISCAVFGNEEIKVSLPGEVIPKREFYDYIAKYVADDTEYKMPAALPKELQERVMRLSVEAYRACFCDGMARVDLFLTKTDELLVSELNTIPGFTSHSLFPKLWEASGLSYKDLLTALIDLGFRRFEKRKKLKTTYEEGKLLV